MPFRGTLVAFLVLISATPAVAAPGTSLLSRDDDPPGTTGRGYAPSISADGRFAAFSDGTVVLVRDLRTGAAEVASRADGPDGAELRAFSPSHPQPAISADGRMVTFEWSGQIFVRDLVADSTTLVSRATGLAGAMANSGAYGAAISADGRHVAFTSSSSNLDPADTEAPGRDETIDVFVRDLETATTTLVSRASGAAGANGNRASSFPSISADGRYVAFDSNARNLHADDRDGEGDIYVRDLVGATTVLVGRGPARVRGNGVPEAARDPSISADGRVVAFTSFVHFDVKPEEYWKDLVFVRELGRPTAKLASVAWNGEPEDGSSPELSSDGRYLAFASSASTLQPFFTGTLPDIYVRDLERGRTVLASRAANRFGTPASGGTLDPSISGDGRLVVFEARASNLHPHDRDRSGDVFLRDLGPDPFAARVRARCLGRRANAIVLPRSSSPFDGTDAADVVAGSSGRDRLSGGPGRDRLCGRGGRDLIRSRDGRRDRVDCGPGRDRVVADARDRVRGCELR